MYGQLFKSQNQTRERQLHDGGVKREFADEKGSRDVRADVIEVLLAILAKITSDAGVYVLCRERFL